MGKTLSQTEIFHLLNTKLTEFPRLLKKELAEFAKQADAKRNCLVLIKNLLLLVLSFRNFWLTKKDEETARFWFDEIRLLEREVFTGILNFLKENKIRGRKKILVELVEHSYLLSWDEMKILNEIINSGDEFFDINRIAVIRFRKTFEEKRLIAEKLSKSKN